MYTDKNPVAHLQMARLGAVEQRWVAQLASFDYEVKYRLGKANVNADALSRLPVPSREAASLDRGRGADPEVYTAAIVSTSEETAQEARTEEWAELQAKDPDVQLVRRAVEHGVLPPGPERKALPDKVHKLLQQWRRLEIREGVLVRKAINQHTQELCYQVVCPSSRCREVWRQCHEAAAHAGAERTMTWIRRRFYWPDMEEEVRQWQQECVPCGLQKGRVELKASLHPIPMSYPLEVIGLDFLLLSRPSDVCQNILVATDLFTRFAWAIPTRDQTAETTVKALWAHIVQPFGCPARFHSDQGPNFESAILKQFCDTYGMSKRRTTPYHPVGNGGVERFNQTLLNMLRTLGEAQQNRWPDHLSALVHAYNNKVHGTTGYAPAFLMFGRHLRMPIDSVLGIAP